jgi:hypothetical protein
MVDTTPRNGVGNGAKNSAKRAANKADDVPWLEPLAQVGVAAIGLVHLLLAWLALQVAFGGSGGESADNTGALKEIAEKPFGKVLLGVMAVGLFAYAVWQGISAGIGFRSETDDKKRYFKRGGAALKSVIGLLLGLQAARLAMGSSQQSSSSKQQDWTGQLLDAPAGKALVVVAGLAVLAYAVYLGYRGVKKKFLESLKGHPGQGLTRFGQAGYIARGVVFGIVGVLLIVAGVKEQPEKARGLDGALKTLADQPFGTWLLTLVALGLGAYGVFRLITARQTKAG